MWFMNPKQAAGLSVVNIDNGFGAGYSAAIIQQLVKEDQAVG
jgi:NCAIR mutase (PurE)-related protein